MTCSIVMLALCLRVWQGYRDLPVLLEQNPRCIPSDLIDALQASNSQLSSLSIVSCNSELNLGFCASQWKFTWHSAVSASAGYSTLLRVRKGDIYLRQKAGRRPILLGLVGYLTCYSIWWGVLWSVLPLKQGVPGHLPAG